jgi:hypothetical protein
MMMFSRVTVPLLILARRLIGFDRKQKVLRKFKTNWRRSQY